MIRKYKNQILKKKNNKIMFIKILFNYEILNF